jgi:hypothetical protein
VEAKRWTRPLLLWIAAAALGCWPSSPSTTEEGGLSADVVFWRAYSDPGTFDAWLSTQIVSKKAAACLQERSSALLSLSQSRLRQCGQLVTGSDAWNECHNESEQYETGGIIAGDLARTLQGTTQFKDTDGGRYLILAKSVVGASDWEATMALVRSQLPPVECK